MRTVIALYALAAVLALLGASPPDIGATHAFLGGVLAALPAIAGGVSAVSGMLQGRKKQKSANRMNERAVKLAEEDYESRRPLRDRATQMMLGPMKEGPAFNPVAQGQRTDFSGSRGMIAGAGGRSGAADRARELSLGAAESVGGGAGRGEIASKHFQNILEQAEDASQLGTRKIGQDAAKFGRVGAGGVTTSLGDLNERIRRAVTQEGRGLAADAAAGDISDRFNRLGALSGFSGQLSDIDMGRAGLDLQRGGMLADIGSREFGEGTQLRGEERVERGTERDFYQGDVANRMGMIDRLAGHGFQSPDTGPLIAGASSQAAQGANQRAGAASLVGALSDLYGRRRQKPNTTTTPGTYTPYTQPKLGAIR